MRIGVILLGMLTGALGSSGVGFKDPGFCSTPEGIIKDACGATFHAVEETNHMVRPVIKDLVKTDYFRYYKVDLSGDNCPFVDEDYGICGNRACAVDPVDDESELPEFWRTQYLGKLTKNSYMSEDEWNSSCDLDLDSEYEPARPVNDSLDYCYPEDESTGSPGVYVSLPDNPERFTGYSGAHAHKIWRAVYQENCFGYFGDHETSPVQDHDDDGQQQSPLGFSDVLSPGGLQLEKVIHDTNSYEKREIGGEVARDIMNLEEQCVEQRLFYRLLSGMQASISTHLCYEYLNKTTGEWAPNVDCFLKRVGNHPERLSNLYFNYALMSRAVAKLRNYIDSLNFCREDINSDQSTRRQILKLTKLVSHRGDMFNETQVFATPEAQALKSEFRKRVRNVNALMSCVGCDKCRLWGKIQTAGYGTGLKLLFELPERPDDDIAKSAEVLSTFRRSELVALINTFDRLSKSVQAIEYFRAVVNSEKGTTNTDDSTTPGSSSSQWDAEWTNVWNAIKFILQSYVDFPRNIWNIGVHYFAHYWNRFIGRDEYLWSQQYATAVRMEL